MPYQKIKNLDNPLILKGKTYQFIDFKFDQSKAKDIANIYTKKYGIDCKLFTINVTGIVGKKVGYGIYSTWRINRKR
jgi:hypothetical protein